MAIAERAYTSVTIGTDANVTFAHPSPLYPGDLLLAIYAGKSYSAEITSGTFLSDYTQISNHSNGSVVNSNGFGSVRLQVGWRTNTGQAAPAGTTSETPNPRLSAMAAYQNATGQWDVEASDADDVDATGTSISATAAETMDIKAGDYLLFVLGAGDNISVSGTNISIPGCTWAGLGTHVSGSTTTGNDGALRVIWCSVDSGTASGPPTLTTTSSVAEASNVAGTFVRLREVGYPGIRAATGLTAGTSTAAPFNVPAGTSEGDLMLAFLGAKPHNLSVTSGDVTTSFTKIVDLADGTADNILDGGSVRAIAYKRTAGASEPGSYTGNLSAGALPRMTGMVSIFGSGPGAYWNVETTSGTDTDASTTAFSATAADTLSFGPGDYVLAQVVMPTDKSLTAGTIAVPGCTLTSTQELFTTEYTGTDNDGTLQVFAARVVSGTASGAASLTFTASTVGASGLMVVYRAYESAEPVAIATETEVALPFAASYALTQVAEAETAIPFTLVGGSILATATETETALPFGVETQVNLALVVESETALSFTTIVPVVLSVDTGQISVAAPSWSAPTLGSSISLMIDTAVANVQGSIGFEVELSGGPITLDIESMEILFTGTDVRSTIGTYAPGDLATDPIEISGSGSETWSWSAYTVDDDDALVVPDNPSTASIWFRYTQTGELTITPTGGTSGGGLWQIITATDEVDMTTWEIEAAGPMDGSPYTFAVSGPTYIRLEPDEIVPTGTLSWSFTEPAADEAILEIRPTQVIQTPGSMRVSLSGGPEDSAVEFRITGAFTAPIDPVVVTTDSTGQVIDMSIAIPALPAGTYTVLALHGSEVIAQASFDILLDPPVRPTTPVADTPPLEVVQVGVRKWVLQDPAPGGEEYLFPINPSSMDSPHIPMEVTTAQTVAPNGQAFIWQAAPRAKGWSFSGYTTDQAFYEALERFRALRHRFYLIDHRNQAWVVSFTDIEWNPRRNVEHPTWSFDYKVNAVIYKGPVTPV
jgi:hypothetical protein